MIQLKNKPTIIGEKIVLRPFKKEDIIQIEKCLKDPEVIILTGSDSDYDDAIVREWYNTRNFQTDRLDLAIEEKEKKVLVGEVVANCYDLEKNSMNFRILIGPMGRDRGFGTEATRLFIEYIFNNTDLNQITLSVYAFNPRAQRVYEKAGFELESIDYEELDYNGEKIDSYNMVLTREKYSKLH